MCVYDCGMIVVLSHDKRHLCAEPDRASITLWETSISVSAVPAGDWAAKQVLWTRPALFPVRVLTLEHKQIVYVKAPCFSHTEAPNGHTSTLTRF